MRCEWTIKTVEGAVDGVIAPRQSLTSGMSSGAVMPNLPSRGRGGSPGFQQSAKPIEGFRIPAGVEDELLPTRSALKFDSIAVEVPAAGITVVAERWPRGIRSEPRWQLPDRAVAALLREPESVVVVI